MGKNRYETLPSDKSQTKLVIETEYKMWLYNTNVKKKQPLKNKLTEDAFDLSKHCKCARVG